MKIRKYHLSTMKREIGRLTNASQYPGAVRRIEGPTYHVGTFRLAYVRQSK